MFQPITENDIDRMEHMLLPAGAQFDEQRRAIIHCAGSVDINACPGSGKTTVMMAKLLLLAEQMPLKTNQGICVLTHTNVGVNEIKERLGLPDSVLFKHPNHFGTIQSFVNKFLAIPGYIHKFSGKRPSLIDQDWHNQIVAKRYDYWWGSGKGWIGRKDKPVALLQGYKFNPTFDNILERINGDPVFKNKGAAYNDIFSFKMDILNAGILSYDDAYVLGAYYLDRFPRVSALVRQRFPMVIIDEMQDTDNHQLALLNKVFDPASTIIQRIGDDNQAIFNQVSSGSFWVTEGQTLPLSGSKRFSNRIANQIDKVCISPRGMSGNPDIPALHPTIILFSQGNITQVIPHFANLIIEADLPATCRGPYKAVGWVKETDPLVGQIKNCVKSYWPLFSGVNKAIKTEFANLGEYLAKPDEETKRLKGTAYHWDRVLLVLMKLLRMAQKTTDAGSFYSKTTLVKKLQSHPGFYDALQAGMVNWVKAIQNNDPVQGEVRDFLAQQFLPLFQIQANAEITGFLNDQNAPGAQQQVQPVVPVNQLNHVYNGTQAQHNGKQVDIQINSIHSVKGETHSATLYMETFYRAADINRIIRYLKIGQGNHIPAIQTLIMETLKMAYVAMSRPSHLLCVAINSADITQADIDALTAAGWAVDVALG